MDSPGVEVFFSVGALGTILTGEGGAIADGAFETAADRSGEAVVSDARTDAAGVCAGVSTAALLDVSTATRLFCEAPPRMINGACVVATVLDCGF